MAQIWVTNGTPTMPGILNPVTAACDQGYVPDNVWMLSNPSVAEYVTEATNRFEVIIDAYGGDADVYTRDLDDETDFHGIIDFYRSTIETVQKNDDTIAGDVTPGRKFMSAIAFQSGFKFDADHVFYFHRKAEGYYGQFYAEIPRTATDLIDFTKVL
ncbi:PDDEXK family nuclease [Halopenitus persicus]|uniref:Uncharacterized protein n=1 Tax=Halopenitus persicus TaxID=1048396 RepID=A0A1H3NRU4_9EURY|nr:hypothetical protein [Halopenitus persicus]SDY91145.1 hypothetical protein SAMN05216564_11435 [Halopenitus persicus]